MTDQSLIPVHVGRRANSRRHGAQPVRAPALSRGERGNHRGRRILFAWAASPGVCRFSAAGCSGSGRVGSLVASLAVCARWLPRRAALPRSRARRSASARSARWSSRYRSRSRPPRSAGAAVFCGGGLYMVCGRSDFWPPIGPLPIAHGRSLFPPHLVGRGLTSSTRIDRAARSSCPAISGFVIELFPQPRTVPTRSTLPLGVRLQAALILLACLAYSGAPNPRRSRCPSATPDGRATCIQKGQYHLLFPCVLCGAMASYCGAVAPCVTAALPGRFLPRLGPLGRAALFLANSRSLLFFCQAEKPTTPPPPDRAAAPRSGFRPPDPQRLKIRRHAGEGGGTLESPLVHVKRAIEFELHRMQSGGRIAVMLGDKAPA